MNSHVPQSIQDLWRGFTFTGRPFDYKGKQYIKAEDKLQQKKFAIPLDGSGLAISMKDLRR